MKTFTPTNAFPAFIYTRIIRVVFLLIVAVTPASMLMAQQAVSAIVTDYNSYWKTSAAAVNPVKPANSHNLLAFTYNGTQYSTGANDAALRAHGEVFTAGDFWSLPVENYSGTIVSNTKVGVGELYDGVHNGAGSTPPENSISRYLTDGIKGLDLGTCIANLPVGTLTFVINNVKPEFIGDGIPDIIVTQIADPSGSSDRYSFLDNNNNLVGQTTNIIFNNIAPVGNWTADFYEAATNPMILTPGFTNTDRPVRLWAADLSDFGITQSNYQSIHKFQIQLSGNSDVAFAAYNNRTFNIAAVLPVKLADFSAKAAAGKNILNWSTVTENNSRYFIVERSVNNAAFTAIDTIAAAGNSNTEKRYTTIDHSPKAGTNSYRLRMVDMNGAVEYSKTVQVQVAAGKLSMSVYPNPATDKIIISYPANASAVKLYNSNGLLVKQAAVNRNASQTSIAIQDMATGVYYAICETSTGTTSMPVIIR